MFIYKFLDQYDNTIYVGKTNNLKNRLTKQHFTERGHLPQECYAQTTKIQYAAVNSQNEATMYELYYIQFYQPYYNQANTGGGDIQFQLPELKWLDYQKPITNQKRRPEGEQLQHSNLLLDSVQNTLLADSTYLDRLVQDAIQFEWLADLPAEQNYEILRVLYSIESFIENLKNTSGQIAHHLQNNEFEKNDVSKHLTNQNHIDDSIVMDSNDDLTQELEMFNLSLTRADFNTQSQAILSGK